MSSQDPTPPPEPPYGQPPAAPRYDQQAEPPYAGQPAGGGASPYGTGAAPGNGLGLAALIVGIVAFVFSWIPGVGFIGIVAIILGIVGLSRVRRRAATNRGTSIAGIILGALAAVITTISIVLTVFFFQQVGDGFSECVQLDPSSTEYQECIAENFGG